jgi:AcrR family transcriptional regulator
MTSDHPTNQRRSPKQARSRATWEAIVEAASQILERRGAEALSTTEVAERAGVSVGTLYQYFPDKHAILLAAARREVGEDALPRPGLQRALIKTLLEMVESLSRLGDGVGMQMTKVHANTVQPAAPRRARRSTGWESRGMDMVRRGMLDFVAPVEPALIQLRNRRR